MVISEEFADSIICSKAKVHMAHNHNASFLLLMIVCSSCILYLFTGDEMKRYLTD